MGPKTRQMNTRYRVKQTSTPLNEGDSIHSFPSLKNISTVKVLRKRTIILTRESPRTLKNRTKQMSTTCRRSEQKFFKKYNSRPRRDTPLKPMNSFMAKMSGGNPKRLKFSQISDTLDRPNNSKNEDYSSLFGEEASDDQTELFEITGDPTENTMNGWNVPMDTCSTLTPSEGTDELNGIKVSRNSNLQVYSESKGNISSENIKHSLQTRVVSELTLDTSSSVETCRRQSSSLLLPPSLNFSLSEDVLSEESVGGNLEKDINLTPLSILSKHTKNESVTKFEAILENGIAFNRSTSWTEVREDGGLASEVDYASNCVATIPFVNHDPGLHLEEKTPSKDREKVKILDAKDENTQVTVNDGKFCNHLQRNAAMVDINTERKSCKRNVDIVPLTSERKSSGSQDSVSSSDLVDSERKSKDVFEKPLPAKKNNARKKYRDRKKKAKNLRSPSLKPYTSKKGGEVSTNSISWNKIPTDSGHANVVDDVSDRVATIPYASHDPRLYVKKETPSCVPQKAQILDAKDESANMFVSDGKFGDHLQHNATVVDIQTERKNCKKNVDVVPSRTAPERKSSEFQDYVSDFGLVDSERKSKDVFKKPLPAKKNNAKKKYTDRKKKAKDVRYPSLQPYTRKEGNAVSTKSAIRNKIPIDGGHASVVDDASNCVATISYASNDTGLHLEKNTPSCDLQTAQIIDAKDESANMTVSDGKFGDHLQHNATVADIQTERKHCKKRFDVVPLPVLSGKKPSESQNSVKDFSLADSGRKIKDTFKKPLPAKKNNPKKKSRASQKKTKCLRSPSLKPSARKKRREVKKRKGKIIHPSMSTPLISSDVAIKRFAAPLEDISPLGTLEENSITGHYEVDYLHFKRTRTRKTYGRRKSELSRRWDSFLSKDPNYSKIAKENNCKEESPKPKRVLPRKHRLLFQTPPSNSLGEIPIDDIFKYRYEWTRKKISETRNINETDETSMKWNECTKIQHLADHFNEISKYSLIIEPKRLNKK